MIPGSTSVSLRVEGREIGDAVLADHSCGSCAECRHGAPLWCASPAEEGTPLGGPIASPLAPAMLRAVLTAAATLAGLAQARSGPIAILGPGAGAVRELLSPTVDRTIHTASSGRDEDLRRALAEEEETGRAVLIAALDDVRDAVRSVRRGGVVAAPPTAGVLPSVTELVQREIRLVAPADARPAAADSRAWARAITALEGQA